MTADAGEAGVREPFLQRKDEVGTKLIAGSFSGDQRDPKRARIHGDQRIKDRSERSMNSERIFSSLVDSAAFAICTRASASGMPER